MIPQANNSHRKAGVTILISDETFQGNKGKKETKMDIL